MANRIQLRRGTAANWASFNPVLAQGEPGIESDTGKQKFGNGTTAWASLPYASAGPQGPAGAAGAAGVADDASVKTLVTTPGSQTATALNATYVPQWKPNTAYAAGQAVLNPTGDVVTAIAAHTSGATHTPANWNISTTYDADSHKLSPLARLYKATAGQFRIGSYGMSISSFVGSLLLVLPEHLKTLYGEVGEYRQLGGGLGGSFTAALNGWEKQPFGGPSYVRARGKSTSTTLTFFGYGDTVRLYFSVEADAAAANISIDGVVVGTTPAAGSQAYRQRQTFTVTAGHHKVEIAAPASGYAYFEEIEISDSTRPGVQFFNYTYGGSKLVDMVNLVAPTGAQVAGIPISGNNGIASHFDRDDLDLIFVGQDVNDAGSGMWPAPFKTVIDQAVTYGRTRGIPVVLQSAMAGHYANPAETANYAQYAAIRTYYMQLAAQNNHVTHIDWHGATAMSDINAYAARYYPGVTITNQATGAFSDTGGTGFIHPTNTPGFPPGINLAAKKLGVPVPLFSDVAVLISDRIRRRPLFPANPLVLTKTARRVTDGYTIASSTSTITTTAAAHFLKVGDAISFPSNVPTTPALTGATLFYVQSVPAINQFTLSTTPGGALLTLPSNVTSGGPIWGHMTRRYSAPAGGTLQNYGAGTNGIVTAYFRDPTIANGAKSAQDAIDASATSDQYGPYQAWSNNNIYADIFGLADGTPSAFTIRASGAISFRAQSPIQMLSVNGTPMLADTAGTQWNFGYTSAGNEPVVVTVLIARTGTGSAYLTVSGSKVYEVSAVHGSAPILTNG